MGDRLPAGPAARPWLARPRLLALLQQRFERRLVLLLAGPGFGKSTVLGQAVAENRLAPRGVDVWCRCPTEASIASVFATSLLAALGPARPPPDPGDVVRAVTADVWRRAPADVALVLDDAHRLAPGSPGAALLARLLDELPANGHLMLATRTPPALPTARLASQRQLVTIDENDLRFDADELTRFAALRDVPREQLDRVAGWPALAELSANAERTLVADYLWQELLDGLHPDRRRLLAAVALVGVADDELLTAIAGALGVAAPGAGAILGELPLVETDGDGGWSPARAVDVGTGR